MVPWLAQMAFPWVKFSVAQQADEIMTFELVACVVVNWTHGWYATLPAPPVRLLGTFELCLQHHDSELLVHLRRLGVPPDQYFWPLMSSLFSEVLPRPQWLQLWDWLFTSWRRPQLLPFAALAYLKHFRASLLAARAEIASLTVAHAALAKQHEAARAEQGATLAAIKADPRFAEFALVKQSRLSAMEVPPKLAAALKKKI